jgi:MoaA/NifB/PqqE/SkfB family radical SAM enzyme
MRHDLLANDVVVMEDNCNLSCEYCLTGQSNFKKGHSLKQIFEPPRLATYDRNSELRGRVDGLLAGVESGAALPILKLTGGEIFWIRNIMELLREVARRYATLVIQTNGVLLTDAMCDEVKSWGNACLQISLDAVSYEGNSYRSRSEAQHQKVLGSILRILDKQIPTEIYLVLNDRSLPWLEDTLQRLMVYRDHLTVCAFPVRGPDKEKFYPRADQLHHVDDVIARYDDYAAILPPRPYMLRLKRFLEDGGRTFRCHLPRFAFTTFDDGIVTPCPNIWFNSLGNVLKQNPAETIEKIGTEAFYQILLAERPRIDACKGCFTPWDMLSLYVDGEISLDELCKGPMYSAPESRARIAEIAATYRSRTTSPGQPGQPCSRS